MLTVGKVLGGRYQIEALMGRLQSVSARNRYRRAPGPPRLWSIGISSPSRWAIYWPWRTSIPILAAMLGGMVLLGVVAEIVHRGVPGR